MGALVSSGIPGLAFNANIYFFVIIADVIFMRRFFFAFFAEFSYSRIGII